MILLRLGESNIKKESSRFENMFSTRAQILYFHNYRKETSCVDVWRTLRSMGESNIKKENLVIENLHLVSSTRAQVLNFQKLWKEISCIGLWRTLLSLGKQTSSMFQIMHLVSSIWAPVLNQISEMKVQYLKLSSIFENIHLVSSTRAQVLYFQK